MIEEQLPYSHRRWSEAQKAKPCVLRFWDMFDGWMDISTHENYDEALKAWMKETEGGTRKKRYEDFDYYDIYPGDTRMLITPEFTGR